MRKDMTNSLVVISGCSGGGKSTLLSELARRGFRTFEEPGRRIVREEQARGGSALPWVDAGAFAARCIEVGVGQWDEAQAAAGGVSFFDRSVVDAFNAFEQMGLAPPARFADALARVRYHALVFMAPPWPEIYETDAERKHGFDDGVREYEALSLFYPRCGYALAVLPKDGVAARADFVLERLR
jgi:predicted ATPase